jgi:hypothetical protein
MGCGVSTPAQATQRESGLLPGVLFLACNEASKASSPRSPRSQLCRQQPQPSPPQSALPPHRQNPSPKRTRPPWRSRPRLHHLARH